MTIHKESKARTIEKFTRSSTKCILTIDVEEWFHILDTPVTPFESDWVSLESRVEIGLNRILDLLDKKNVKATFFWLGWVAKQQKSLVQLCYKRGHEIASHGYSHILPFKTDRSSFFSDIKKAKSLLEDIIGNQVVGYRAPGFGIMNHNSWAFDSIREAGYMYDSSVFAGQRGHGGMVGAPVEPHKIETSSGVITEFPVSMVKIMGKYVNLFGGGYLRLAPFWIIRYGIEKLKASGRPLISYVHPREVDPEHPKLPLGPKRKFKSYVNLRSTLPKLHMICESGDFCTMRKLWNFYFEK